MALTASSDSLAQGKQADGLTPDGEWNLLHPKANDPEAFPEPDETSLDLHRLQKATSLKEMYELAYKMGANSVSDNRVLTYAAFDYMKKCCADYDSVIEELTSAGFREIRDITKAAQFNPQAYFLQKEDFDKAIYSERNTHWDIINAFPMLHIVFTKYTYFLKMRN